MLISGPFHGSRATIRTGDTAELYVYDGREVARKGGVGDRGDGVG